MVTLSSRTHGLNPSDRISTVLAGRFARPCLLAALVYAALALVLVSPGLVPGRTLSASDVLWHSTPWSASVPPGVPGLRELGDQALQFDPFLLHTRSSLPHIPLWDSAIMAGRPFLANGQSAVFSPFSVPAYALPFWRALALVAALKLFVAALGTYLLGRALGMGFGGALLAGVVFAFSFWFSRTMLFSSSCPTRKRTMAVDIPGLEVE